jgi:hypothetical protein
MATFSASATAYATASASATASYSASATATSTISQEDAEQLALQEANQIAQNTSAQNAYNTALSELGGEGGAIVLYVALLFKKASYINGLTDTLELIQSEFPNSKLVFEEYVVDGSPGKTDAALIDFINKYPTGNRVTVSQSSSVLLEISMYLEKNNIDIFSLSISATSLFFKTRTNLFTYGYYLDTSVMTSFLILKNYNLQNIVVLVDTTSLNYVFLESYLSVIQEQNKLLNNLNVIVYDLSKVSSSENIYIPENSFVYLLADTQAITNTYINQIQQAFTNNKTSCIFLTDVNDDIEDIFGDIPAFVSILAPVNYTTTSNMVYSNLKNKSFYVQTIYAFYDILYTLQFMSDSGVVVTNENYVNSQAFQNIPEAYSNSIQLDKTINGFKYGMYDIIFTSNSLLNTQELLDTYNKYNFNDGAIYKLKGSESIFSSAGIVPFFASNMYYNDQNLIKVYDENNNLKYVKFDNNNTKDENGNYIAVTTYALTLFILNYDEETNLFSYLEKTYPTPDKTNPAVNLRMSKVDQTYYL